MKAIFILCLIIIARETYSQNDTIHLMKDCLILNGDTFNKTKIVVNKFFLLEDDTLNIFRNFIIALMESLDES